jgi:hypothetical protein
MVLGEFRGACHDADLRSGGGLKRAVEKRHRRLFRRNGAQEMIDEFTDHLVRLRRSSNGQGNVVENGEFRDGSPEPFVLFLERGAIGRFTENGLRQPIEESLFSHGIDLVGQKSRRFVDWPGA